MEEKSDVARGAWAWSSALIFFGFLCVYSLFFVPKQQRVLYIYNWAHYIPDTVIQEFERQEGIKVQYDTFDTLEILEAKLLAAHSGYDVVFPPALPTLKLFAPTGIFEKLDLSLLPNRKYIDPNIKNKMRIADPEGCYAMPYLWGTTGFIYHKKIVSTLAEGAPLDSWELLFSKVWMKKLAPYRVVLLDSPADVFSDILFYKGLDPLSNNLDELKEAAQHLFALRPFVYKFDSSQILQDILSERIAIAEIFSSYAHMAMAKLKEKNGKQPYRYVIPKEGALMWIDTMAIPKDSAHKAWAHKFINFLMRPKIIAQITNQTRVANAITDAARFVDPAIEREETIYPNSDIQKRLVLDRIPTRRYERMRLRYWTMIRAGYNP